MAKRLYLNNESPPYTPATIRGLWDGTTGAVTRKLGGVRSGSTTTIGVTENNATNNWDILLGRWISDPLTSGITFLSSDTVSWSVGCQENSTSANDITHIFIYATQGDSDSLRAIILNDSVADTTEWTTTMSSKYHSQVVTSAVTLNAGDRIVVEFGYRAQNTSTTSYSGTIRYGGSGTTDLNAADGDTAVSTRWPWVQFSANIVTPDLQLLTPVSIFTNSNSLALDHTLTKSNTLAQSSTYSDTDSLAYQHVVLTPTPQTLTQTSSFGNSNTLNYQATLSTLYSLIQTARFNATNSLSYTHSLTSIRNLTQSARFDNSNSLSFQQTLTSVRALIQSATFSDTDSLAYNHSSLSVYPIVATLYSNTNSLAFDASIIQQVPYPQVLQSPFWPCGRVIYPPRIIQVGTLYSDETVTSSNSFYSTTVDEAGNILKVARFNNFSIVYVAKVDAGRSQYIGVKRTYLANSFYSHMVIRNQKIRPAPYWNRQTDLGHTIN